MRVDVYATIADIQKEELSGADAAVIDVLRMTSTVTNALSNGAKRIKLVGDEQKARATAQKESALLGGERGGVKLPGFAFGNSPLEYTRNRVFENDIVMTTTNGARASEAVTGAKRIILCSFLNVLSVSESLKNSDHVIILCAGTHDRFSLDDCLCAGALCAYLNAEKENDLAVCMRLMFDAHKNDISFALQNTMHYRYLKSIGFTEDLAFCLRLNTHSCVPVMDENGWFLPEKFAL